MWRHLPNLISGLRVLLVLPVFWAISERDYGIALLIAAVAGASDAVDGYLAKRFDWQSRLGEMLDPLADKLLLMAAFLALVLVDELPMWLFALVIARDVLIVAGAVAYHNLIGPFDAQPSRLSKLTTLVQILCVLAELLRLSVVGALPGALLVVPTALLTAASGIHYVVVWSMRAWRTVSQRRHGDSSR